jgi:hypothetical protein
MKRGTDAHNFGVGGRLFRFFIFFGATIKISVNTYLKGLPNLFYGSTMKRYGVMGNIGDGSINLLFGNFFSAEVI